jgi:deazaflavin-dependent oxidoreductase (nitroreductase family)
MAGGIQDFNQKIIAEFRANQGKVGGQFKGMPLLLLTTKGAKSGVSRTNPLAYLRDGDRYVIIASYAGAPKNPPWYHNLVASPTVRVEVGAESFDARAEVVKEPERSALYQRVEAAMPVFSEYKRKTQRSIPVIALRRIGS